MKRVRSVTFGPTTLSSMKDVLNPGDERSKEKQEFGE